MKTDRLFAIVIYLLNHGKTSAKELADRFEVSVRTIQRDMDSIGMANIPVIAETGVKGGYYLAENFTINANTMTEEEYQYTLTALQGLASVMENAKVEDVMEKIVSVAGRKKQDIRLDFSSLKERDTDKITVLRQAIQSQKQVVFEYTNAGSEVRIHTAEPMVVVYRWYAWYLIAYSVEKNAYGMYKLVRMQNVTVTEKVFQNQHESPEAVLKGMEQKAKETDEKVYIKCRRKSRMKVIEYLNGKIVKEYDNGDCEMTFGVVPGEFHWLGALMALGNEVEVLEPEWIREKLVDTSEKILSMYKEL